MIAKNIKHDYQTIQAWINKTEKLTKYICGVKRGHKNNLNIIKKEYERLSEHIGLYPLVYDFSFRYQLIWDGSEVRRKFMDSIISQYDKVYLEKLISYNHVLQQRNALLKHFHEKDHLIIPV